MPIKSDREYRAMPVLEMKENRAEQRLDTDYYVEGYATTFNQPYLLWDDGEVKFYEEIDARAFDNADMSDVLFLHNHEGKCFARTKMKRGKAPTLLLEVDNVGLFTAADLSTIEEGRQEHNAIINGLVYQMSFAFTVADDEITKIGEDEYLRTIKAIRKVYDVSSVDMPANPFTDISARSAFEGFIESEKQELLERQKEAEAREAQKRKIKILLEATK